MGGAALRRYFFRKLAAYQAVKRSTASVACSAQTLSAVPRWAGPATSPGPMLSDPSVSELLALTAPLPQAAFAHDAASRTLPNEAQTAGMELAAHPHVGKAGSRSPRTIENSRSGQCGDTSKRVGGTSGPRGGTWPGGGTAGNK